MLDTWDGVARLLAVVGGMALMVPVMIYLVGRSIAKTHKAMDRDSGVITTHYKNIAARPDPLDDPELG